jgi:hypothetical protein
MAGLFGTDEPKTPSWRGDGGLATNMTRPSFSAYGQQSKDSWMQHYETSLQSFRQLPSDQLAAYGRQLSHAQKVGNGDNPALAAAIAAYTTAMDERRPPPDGLLSGRK